MFKLSSMLWIKTNSNITYKITFVSLNILIGLFTIEITFLARSIAKTYHTQISKD